MKKAITLLSLLAMALLAFSQSADFENFNLGTDDFLNGSDGSGGFQSGQFFFPNKFTDWGGGFTSWNGWAISSMTDTNTFGFENEFSCIAGSGADGSGTYAVSYVSGHSTVHSFVADHLAVISSISITNSAYAYWSMKMGDSYAKQFGGLDGNDPDFFLLTIKGYRDGVLVDDSIDFYLADYRFDDNSMDYIVDDWTLVDISPFGKADSLLFTLTSSDVGSFGMNTPAYFCLDNLVYELPNSAGDHLLTLEVDVFPNPTTDFLQVEWKERTKADVFVYGQQGGQLVHHQPLTYGLQTIGVQSLPSGMYFLKIQTDEGWASEKFVKK